MPRAKAGSGRLGGQLLLSHRPLHFFQAQINSWFYFAQCGLQDIGHCHYWQHLASFWTCWPQFEPPAPHKLPPEMSSQPSLNRQVPTLFSNFFWTSWVVLAFQALTERHLLQPSEHLTMCLGVTVSMLWALNQVAILGFGDGIFQRV